MSKTKSLRLKDQTSSEERTKLDQQRSLNTISRMYDNHYDKKIHEHPWFALGIFKTDKMIQYEHSDVGLSFNNIKIQKLHTFRELWEKNIEIKDKQSQHQGFRHFREFEDIQEEDVMVTIEYCTNCHNHTGSTRHSEGQYSDAAFQLKKNILKRFPVCKVYLKPLIYDQFDHSIDTMFLQRRLGCFEVQVLSRQKGDLKREVIFSKLKTKSWPDAKHVISKLPKYFKKCTLTLQLKFQGQENIQDEQELNQLQSKLRNVVLQIQPVREFISSLSQNQYRISKHGNSVANMRPNQTLSSPQNTKSAYGSPNPLESRSLLFLDNKLPQNKQNRPWSSQTRPKSAYSTISLQTQKTRYGTAQAEQTVVMEDLNIQDKTNSFGQVVLKDIPIDVYEITIKETNDYMSEKTRIDLFEIMDKNGPLLQEIQLKKQTNSFLVIEAIEDAKTDDDFPKSVTEAKVEIIPVNGGKLVAMKEAPQGSGKYEIVVDPGQYNVFVKKIGFNVQKEQISTKAGIFKILIRMHKCAKDEQGYDPIQESIDKKTSQKPPDDLYTQKPKFLNPPSAIKDGTNVLKINLAVFQFIDIVTKKPVENVYIRVIDEANNKLYSYRSSTDGVCRVMLNAKLTRGKIMIEHPDYYEKTEVFGENKSLSQNTNTFFIIRKPQKGQLDILIQNKPKTQFLNFYIQRQDSSIVQTDSDTTQFLNEEDGIQLISFSNLQDKKGIFQVFACMPTLRTNIMETSILLPQGAFNIPQPKQPDEAIKILPYIWVLGCIIDPYDQFDEINKIVPSQQYGQFPHFIRNENNFVVTAVLQPPLYLISAQLDRSLSWWSLDNFKVEQTLEEVGSDIIQKVIVWDDENVVVLDFGQLTWVRRDDNNQWIVASKLQLNRQGSCISKVGIDGLAIGSLDGYIMLISVRIDSTSVTLIKESEIIENDKELVENEKSASIFSIAQIANDQIAFLSDRLTLWKVEKSLDKPYMATQMKAVLIPGHERSPHPLLQLVSLDFRVLAYGGSNGIVNTIRVDTFERGPTFMWNHPEQVTCLLNLGDVGILTQSESEINWTYVETLQDMKDNKTSLIKKIKSPMTLYNDELFYWENRIISFTQNGQLILYPLQQDPFPPMGSYLLEKEFPGNLRPQSSQTTYFVAITTLPKESFQFYFLNNFNEQIQESTQEINFFTQDGLQIIELNTQRKFLLNIQYQKVLQGVWRVGARLCNTEKIKQTPPRIFYVTYNGFQQIPIPSSLPQSKKQVYFWQVGTLVPNYQSVQPSTNFTDGTLSKFPSLDVVRHESRVNVILSLNNDEFITAGEDKQMILWDSKTFQPKKILYEAHKSEILTLYKITDNLIASGSKAGDVKIWKRVDAMGNWLVQREMLFHEKNVYAIVAIEGNTTLVTASDDRRIHVVTLNTGQLETSETVDRTFVNSLTKYQKDCFIGGFPDGRIKMWKKEKSGQKFILKTLRTIITQKVQHLNMLTNNILFLGGIEKLAETINLDTGAKIKMFKDGHQSAIVSSCSYTKKYLLTGGSDGRITIWNLETGLMAKTFETGNDEVKQILVSDNLVITSGSNGNIRVWQEIATMIDQLVAADLEAQKLKEQADEAAKQQ